MDFLTNYSFRVFFVAAVLTLSLGSVSAQASAEQQKKWSGFIEFSAKPGSDRSLAKGDLFLPLQQSENFLLFGNLKANFDDQSYKEGNAGLGARRMYDQWLLGGWVFYDWKESSTGNTFDQMTVGGELLSDDWDLRANVYLAENKVKDSDRASVIELNGNQIQARQGEERALSGVDFEIGKKLPYFDDARFFAGGYYYDANGYEKVSGPKLRLEMRFHDIPFLSKVSDGSRLTLGAEYTEDSVRGSETFGLVQLRIPFSGKTKSVKRSLTSLEKRMMETVRRDDDIITNERLGNTLMPLINPKTGQVITIVETVNAATTNVSNTVSNAGQNSLIIADGSQGDIDIGNSTINTAPGQIIIGGGETILLQAKKYNGSLIDMNYTPAGQRGRINRSGNGELIYINSDDDVTVTGIELSGGRAVRINNSQNVDVRNVNVLSSSTNRQGVYIHNNSSVNFENVSINNTGRQGLLMTSNSSGVFTNLSIDNANREGVYLTSNASGTFGNLSVSNTRYEGVELASSNAAFNNAMITRTGREGLRIRSGSAVTASNTIISKTGSEAIELNNSQLSLRHSSIRDIDVNANRDGIFATNNSTLSVNHVDIDNVTSQGIITTNNTVSTIENVAVRNTGHQGMYFSRNSVATLGDVTIEGAGRQGIYAHNSDITANNLIIDNVARQGAYFTNSTIDINNLNLTNAAFQGIYLNNNTSATLDNTTIQNSGRVGLYVRDSDLVMSNTSISDITANVNQDGIFIYRDSNVTLNTVTVSNVSGDGLQVQGTSTLQPTVVTNDLSIDASGRYGVINTRGHLTLNDALINMSVFDGILVNRGNLTVNNAQLTNSGRFGLYALRSSANINGLSVSYTARDGVLINRSTASLNNSTIRDIGDGDTNDDVIQISNSTVSGVGNTIAGSIHSGVACRATGTNIGSIVFSSGPVASCP